MPKIGLKLWSTNLNYVPLARTLFARQAFDYIELFIIPGSTDMMPQWKQLDTPYVLHAPHSYAGLNPADSSKRDLNLEMVRDVNAYSVVLAPRWVIFHPGVNGDIAESVSQLQSFGKYFPDMRPKIVIENKPLIGLDGERCIGASPDEMRRILESTGGHFCLDFGHAMCYAVASGRHWKDVLEEFVILRPVMFHLSDGFLTPKDAHEHLGQGKYDLPYMVSLINRDAYVSLETKKDSQESLDDFVLDVQKLREYAGA